MMKKEANDRPSVGSGRLHRRDEVWGTSLADVVGIPNLGRNQNGVEDWAVEGM